MKITRIAAQREHTKTRVAVYCRVSTDKDTQEDSLEIQEAAYRALIDLNPDLQLVGVYSDVISGMSAEKRPDFMRMVMDAMSGKIDRILCKSVSRFSRNVAECKKYTDMLRTRNVTVEFEKENLRTDEPASSFLFSLMSAIAENESRSISENVKWGQRERVKRGEYNLGNNRILGYDTVDGKLVPNEEAWIVREIFQAYADGEIIGNIRKKLAAKGVLTRNGTPLSIGGIRYMLTNETYRGDKLLQKTHPKDLITKRPDPNVPFESNYLVADHVAIVDDELWNAVQARLKANEEKMEASGNLNGKRHFLYGKLFCADCGSLMLRRTVTGYKGVKYKAWNCKDRQQGTMGNGCKMRIVKEEELLKEIADQMGWDEFNEERFLEEVVRVDVGTDEIVITRKTAA
jgi:DNA invertase Pin-like site-specific DNA recombinase